MSQKLRVVVSAARQGPWSILADRIESAGADILRIPVDVAEVELPRGWMPDGLVTISTNHQQARFHELDLDRWDEAADQELNGRFRVSKAVARRMLEGNGGSITHLVTADSLPGSADAGSAAILGYASAGLSRGIALDLRDKVRSNVVAVQPDAASIDAAVALILYLCGSQGRDISGQIAAVTQTELQLFSQSRPLRVAHRDGDWDEVSLAAQVERWSADLPRLANAGRR